MAWDNMGRRGMAEDAMGCCGVWCVVYAMLCYAMLCYDMLVWRQPPATERGFAPKLPEKGLLGSSTTARRQSSARAANRTPPPGGHYWPTGQVPVPNSTQSIHLARDASDKDVLPAWRLLVGTLHTGVQHLH